METISILFRIRISWCIANFSSELANSCYGYILGPTIGYDTVSGFEFMGGTVTYSSLITGIILTVVVSTVIFGGIKKSVK